jgi:hypothetical protein
LFVITTQFPRCVSGTTVTGSRPSKDSTMETVSSVEPSSTTTTSTPPDACAATLSRAFGR